MPPKTQKFVRLRRIGNSLGFTLDRDMLESLNWKKDDTLYVEVRTLRDLQEHPELFARVEPVILAVAKTISPTINMRENEQ